MGALSDHSTAATQAAAEAVRAEAGEAVHALYATMQSEYFGADKLAVLTTDVANRLELLEQRVAGRMEDIARIQDKERAAAIESVTAKLTFEGKLRQGLVDSLRDQLEEKLRTTFAKATEGAALVDRVAKLEANAEAPVVSSLGDAKSSLGGAKSSLGDAESSLGDAESSVGDA
jgi:hypothetical protein